MTKLTSSPIQPQLRRLLWFFSATVFASIYAVNHRLNSGQIITLPHNYADILDKCSRLDEKPTPPKDFHARRESDRFEPSNAKRVILRNATIWTGNNRGKEVVTGDVLLENGLIRGVGDMNTYLKDTEVLELHGAWVTPGIVDLHSHMGVESQPGLRGSSDGNSLHGPILPWLRSLDGLNTHDDSYKLVIAGGVTTGLILPGSANAIGGQAFVMKPRPTEERSPTSMLLEPPYDVLNGANSTGSPRWRYMKHACGENPARVYGASRMDTVWETRNAYEQGRKLKVRQDEYCKTVRKGQWKDIAGTPFPEDLQWEAIVDTLRGKVKVNTHCYEAVDFDRFISLSNEFKFPVAAFHHAHEAYLVPGVLKRGYESAPAIAMFAGFSRYKRESFRHSEYAPRILADEGLKVVMKSDHPAIFSRYLLHEAQQAHYFGLKENLALASVISTPAEVLGLDHRIGFIREGYDADIVVWDSHPLSLGATPQQVYIDGIPQIQNPIVVLKPASSFHAPRVPNFDDNAQDAVKYNGLPPLTPKRSIKMTQVLFTNVSAIWIKDQGKVVQIHKSSTGGTAAMADGKIVCLDEDCASFRTEDTEVIDLEGGSIFPALTSVGVPLGLGEIAMEPSTVDGEVYDALLGDVPDILGGELPRAVDGLQFGTRDALLAYRAGVTATISAPSSDGFLVGMGTYASLSARHRLEYGAVLQNVTSIHVRISYDGVASVSTQIAALRRLLLSDYTHVFDAIRTGSVPLAVEVHSADAMASLLRLKSEVEAETGHTLRMVFVGATEVHLIPKEVAQAGVGIILTSPRSVPSGWEGHRMMPGPPLSEALIPFLISHGVNVAIGPQLIVGAGPAISSWAAKNLRFDAGWIYLQSNGTLTEADALGLASTSVEEISGTALPSYDSHVRFLFGSQLRSVASRGNAKRVNVVWSAIHCST